MRTELLSRARAALIASGVKPEQIISAQKNIQDGVVQLLVEQLELHVRTVKPNHDANMEDILQLRRANAN